MQKIKIRFYEELNDFLPKSKQKQIFEIEYFGRQSVKDLIESQGVPHTEIDLILINGISVGFGYIIQPSDFISVYPQFELIDISPVTKLRQKPLRNTKFVLDVQLGKLGKYLRMLGFDTQYQNDYSDNEIIDISIDEERIILTRDIGILKHSKVQRGYWMRNTDPLKQIEEVIMKYDLKNSLNPFSRCMTCNGILKPAEKEKIIERLEPNTKKYFDEFYICQSCNQIYWKGSHWAKMKEKIQVIR
ncbi:Mut7-C RNAse domain-containing protein [Bacteroidota bacterium]